MSQAQNFHDEAMILANEADREIDFEKAKSLNSQAFEKERDAAMLLVERADCEPTRSVRFRSAAWLAIAAGRLKEARQMAILGLRFCKFGDLEAELLDVLNAAHGRAPNSNVAGRLTVSVDIEREPVLARLLGNVANVKSYLWWLENEFPFSYKHGAIDPETFERILKDLREKREPLKIDFWGEFE